MEYGRVGGLVLVGGWSWYEMTQEMLKSVTCDV